MCGAGILDIKTKRHTFFKDIFFYRHQIVAAERWCTVPICQSQTNKTLNINQFCHRGCIKIIIPMWQ